MLASLFQFSFLCVVAVANLCLGFAIASRLGWGPRLAELFQLEQATPHEYRQTRDRSLKATDGEDPAAVERTEDADQPSGAARYHTPEA